MKPARKFLVGFCMVLSVKTDKEGCYALPMKKSTQAKVRKLIYPLAFILVIILSAVYKLVLKGNTDFTVNAFKSGKSEVIKADESISSVQPEATDQTSGTTETPVTETVQLVSVYICGEVINPGIYEAPKGVMLNDIIEDAGGLTDEASVNNINFVYQITCNMSIYIPSKAETANGFSGGDIIRQDGVYVWGGQQGSGSDAGSTSISIVNINTATVEELKTLPGIGGVTAQAIVDYRAKNPFKTVEDIKNVTGIGDSKYNRIKDYICV